MIVEILIPTIHFCSILCSFFNNCAKAAVSTSGYCLQTTDIRCMVIILNGFGIEMGLQQFAAPQILFRADLLFPLKRSMRLRHKEGCGHMNTKASFFVRSMFFPSLDNLIDQLSNAQYIFISLRRQAEHKIKLYIIPSTVKGIRACCQNFLFSKVFVDYIPQPLSSRFGSKRQTALTHCLEFSHQFLREIIRAKRRY